MNGRDAIAAAQAALTPTPPSSTPVSATSPANAAMRAIRGHDEWVEEATAVGKALASGSPTVVIESMAKAAVLLDELFYRTIQDAMKAPLATRASLLKTAISLRVEARATYDAIDRYHRRIAPLAIET